MRRRVKKEQEKPLKVGDFVFAKVRGFRAWPARILRRERSVYLVYFYGTCNIAKVGVAQIYEYEKFKARLGDVLRRANNSFKGAMVHVENSRSRPSLDYGFQRAKAALTDDDDRKQRQQKSAADSDSSASSAKLKKYSKFDGPFVHITGDSDSE
ncbi:hypothetical protein KR093_010641 [Drosophila rubida]|uniref:PWWP domain-containing protein n=1 Tax=Drosophila rubida TaxID=30044 RepID=A0AAD4JUV3_9MUSC|nr:hypothetical protein KR093_010641 [Drosophila rubida]